MKVTRVAVTAEWAEDEDVPAVELQYCSLLALCE